MYRFLGIILFALIVVVMPVGAAKIGFELTEAEVGGVELSIKRARDMGASIAYIGINWDEVERSKDVYRLINNPEFKSRMDAMRDAGFGFHLSINIIESSELRVPGYLEGVPMNDPVFIERSKRFIDQIKSSFGGYKIYSIAIGSEVDIYLGEVWEKWREFAQFYQETFGYVSKHFKYVKAGTEITYGGWRHAGISRYAKYLLDISDVAMVSYYPLGEGGHLQNIRSFKDDFSRIASISLSKPVLITQFGITSSRLVGGSFLRQNTYIRQLIKEWRSNKAVRSIVFKTLVDYSPKQVEAIAARHGVSGSSDFKSYIANMGFFTWAGRGAAKKAYGALRSHAKRAQ